MAKNYIQDGNTITAAPTKAVKSGEVYTFEKLIGVAITDIEANQLGTFATTGVWRLKNSKEDNISIGQSLVLDQNGKFKPSGGPNVVGVAWSNATNQDDYVEVKINVNNN